MLISALVRISTIALLVTLSAASASAWDRFAHFVVGAIAWEHMSDAARARAAELLSHAPPDADLAMPWLTPRELFLRTTYWADVVRDEAWPQRKEKYDRPTWHYVNHFWRDGTALPQMGTNGELLERLKALDRPIADPIDLAWLLHLVGDVHQPLHSSARVSARDPEGDRGGNDFLLDDIEAGNLHAYWDTILRRANRKRHSESYLAWVDRVARDLMEAHPPESFANELAIDDVESWSKVGAEIAMTHAYPDYLVRDAAPPGRYLDDVYPIAQKQVALAGYRLAARLEELLH